MNKLINQEVTQYNIISKLVCDNDNKLFCKFISAYCDSSQYKIYILMEYCGNSLYNIVMSKIKSDHIDELIKINNKKYIYTWLLNIANGLKCMHKNQYVHLDIKPDNIVLDENLNSKLMDFGLILKTDVKMIERRGTLNYVPPEMVSNVPHVFLIISDLTKCDIYSLGITFIECIYALTYPDTYKKIWDYVPFNCILRLDPEEKREKDDTIQLLHVLELHNIKTIKRAMTKVILKEEQGGLHITYQGLYDNIIAIHKEYPLFQRMIKIEPDDRCSIDDIITECILQLSLTSV